MMADMVADTNKEFGRQIGNKSRNRIVWLGAGGLIRMDDGRWMMTDCARAGR